jgi:hypothetical protein
VCELRASARYGRYIRLTQNGHPRIDQANVQALAKLDGKFVVHSNDDTLSAADLALGDKQLQRVEAAWRMLKSGLKLRPVYHWTPHRIHAHVALSVLSLRLERIAEQACGDTWRNIRDDLKRIKLAQLSSPNGTVWQVTEPTPDGLKRLKSSKGDTSAGAWVRESLRSLCAVVMESTLRRVDFIRLHLVEELRSNGRSHQQRSCAS